MSTSPLPRQYLGVMVSSTFKDLEKHRAALLDALRKEELFAIGMEDYVPVPGEDVIGSSLNMVRKGAAYIGLISHRCGQVLECPTRNRNSYSVTRLEFEEALKLGLPTLIFVMSQEHAVKPAHVDRDEKSIAKLNEFREAAKAGRIYIEFDSLEDFTPKAIHAIASLRRYIEEHSKPAATAPSPITPTLHSSIPTPPAFYAKPDFIGRHDFVGRTAQLKTLTEWAKPTDTTSVLLFEAIGGNGKSMLTWEWTTKHAEEARIGHEPWAGRFWYSFYEKGAIMRDFCLHALHYMTQQPMEELEKKPMADLRTALLAQLHARPWLLILDGLERVLVAYHRIDAAEVRDEEVNRPTDKILDRDPCDAIRPEDTELLRALTAARPSKILISSRLIPRVLLNPSGLPLPGVRPLVLPGLDDADAEELFCKVCGIRGTSADIRYYLKTFCDNHPLVIGVLAGLVNSPGQHRGHFDAWAAAPEYGAKLNLASLDLIQSRNHILRAAMDALEAPSRQLLSTLALLTDAVDYETVAALNPHIPPEPRFVKDPDEGSVPWTDEAWEAHQRKYRALSPEKRKERDEADAKADAEYEEGVQRRKEYLRALAEWEKIATEPEARRKLEMTLSDLEGRAFLQFDRRSSVYDMHPVVRGIAAGSQKPDEKEGNGQRVVDHFTTQPHPPYEQARTMEDVASGLHVVRTLLKLGHYQQAAEAYRGSLEGALFANLEAHVETLALLRPFFPAGWDTLPQDVNASTASFLATDAAFALLYCGELPKALCAYGAALWVRLETENWGIARANICAISVTLSAQNLLAKAMRVGAVTLELATVIEDDEVIFKSRLSLFGDQFRLGQWQAADATWRLLDPMGRAWSRAAYRQGDAEFQFAVFQFRLGSLQEEHLTTSATLAEQDNNRATLRDLLWLRGAWRLEQGEWALAAASFDTAVTMAREVRLVDEASETGLALAKHHLGQLTGDAARSEAERLAQLRQPAHRYLAMLWREIGDLNEAKKHALAAYTWAWADGEPYVNRYALTKTTELLNELAVPIPNLPPYDPAKDVPFPWEAEVRAAIEKLRAKKKVAAALAESSDS